MLAGKDLKELGDFFGAVEKLEKDFGVKFVLTCSSSKEDLPEVAIPKKEMGNAIKYLKSRFPQADGKMISEIVKKYIV